jgi:phosphoribosylglycinamide formyltransferase-1
LKKIAVLFSGTGSNLAYILEHLHKKELEVVVAITNRSQAGGIAFAKEYGIPVKIIDSTSFESREVFDAEIVKTLKSYGIELTILAGFMRILTTVFTDEIKAINLHPSLLPRHKGIQAIERSYADEFDMGGVSVHWVTSELDGGEVILQKEVSKLGKTFQEYESEVKRVEKIALFDAILKIISN